MANVTPALVKELREKTGAGMMDCRKALTETDGNIEGAVDWLRKKGLAAAAKKSGRATTEGIVALAVSGTAGALVEVNAETDFVARNEQFQGFARSLAEIVLNNRSVCDVSALKASDFPGTGRTVEAELTQLIATIGENMNLRRIGRLEVAQGAVGAYMHSQLAPGLGKIGVLVALESAATADQLADIKRELAMHIAAARPESVTQAELDPNLIERERAVLMDKTRVEDQQKAQEAEDYAAKYDEIVKAWEEELAQLKAEGKKDSDLPKKPKPPQAHKPMDDTRLANVVEGRIRKFMQEVVLVDQVFVIDGKSRVSEALDAKGKELGSPVKVTAFLRFQLGEGVEKQDTDFAAEVAKTLKR